MDLAVLDRVDVVGGRVGEFGTDLCVCVCVCVCMVPINWEGQISYYCFHR